MFDRTRYLTAQQVAEYLSVSRSTVNALVRAKKIPRPIRITDRVIRWDREAIDKMLAEAPQAGVDWEKRIDEALDRACKVS